MALFTIRPKPGLCVYFNVPDNPDWTVREAAYTDPATGAPATIAADAGWTRSDAVDAQPPAGAVQATIQDRAAGPTGSHPVVVPAASATPPQAAKVQPKAVPKAAPKKRISAKKTSPKKRTTSKKTMARKAPKKVGTRKKAKASRKK